MLIKDRRKPPAVTITPEIPFQEALKLMRESGVRLTLDVPERMGVLGNWRRLSPNRAAIVWAWASTTATPRITDGCW